MDVGDVQLVDDLAAHVDALDARAGNLNARRQLRQQLGQAALILDLVTKIAAVDPDVIENHNLHGFDLPFLARQAQILRVPLALGRIGPPGLPVRAARRGRAEGAGGGKNAVVVKQFLDPHPNATRRPSPHGGG